MTVRYTKLDPRAHEPTYGTDGAAGADLYALDTLSLAPGQTAAVHTGVCVEIPEGFVGLVYARSGLACKQDLAPANKVGVVDCDYRGEITVFLHNHGSETRTVEAGQRVAQLVLTPYLHAEFEAAESLTDTDRGVSGFGSTGK